MQAKTIITHTIVLSDDEMKMLEAAIGSTSVNSRIQSGMSLEQSNFIREFYNLIADANSSSR